MDFCTINQFLQNLHWYYEKDSKDPLNFRKPENWYRSIPKFEYLKIPLEQEELHTLFNTRLNTKELVEVFNEEKLSVTLKFDNEPTLCDVLERVSEKNYGMIKEPGFLPKVMTMFKDLKLPEILVQRVEEVSQKLDNLQFHYSDWELSATKIKYTFQIVR